MNQMIRKSITVLFLAFIVICRPVSAAGAENLVLYFTEGFSDANLSSRGWYDGISGHVVKYDPERESSVIEFNYASTGSQTGLGALRHSFPEADVVSLRYFVKYSTNWEWTGQSYGPHEIYLLTNMQSRYAGPAYSNLTCYIEFNNGKPHPGIQDGMNIDASRINQDLTLVTENRAIAGGNGCGSDDYAHCGAYFSGGKWMNGKGWTTQDPLISNGQWYEVKAEFKMNSFSDGRALPNGHVKFWINNNLVIDKKNVILRSYQHPNMKFNQVIIAPYYHNGAPHPQQFWIDDFSVSGAAAGATEPVEDAHPPAPPVGVKGTYIP